MGDGGTEKTRFLAQCPKPLILDFDAGMASTRDLPPVQYETFKDLPYGIKGSEAKREQGFYPWGESWPRFIDFINAQWDLIEKGDWSYQTLGIDSLTTMSTQCMNYVLKGAGKTAKDNPEIQHWGTQLRLMETTMEQLAAWPVRLVVTAHIKRDDNLVMGTKEFLPMVTGQLSGRIGIYFDELYFTEVKGTGADRKVTFVTQTQASYKQAKSRHNVPIGTAAKWSAIAKYFGGAK